MEAVVIERLVRPISTKVRRRLREAIAYQFDEPVTGFLTHAWIVSGSCLGFVYGHARADEFGRFADGHLMRTSDVRSAWMEGPYWVLTTMNSRYVVVSFKRHDGRPSLQYFLNNLQAKAFPAPHRLQ